MTQFRPPILRVTAPRSAIAAGWIAIALAVTLAIAQQARPAVVFAPAVRQIQSKTRLEILLPSKLPAEIPETAIRLAAGEIRSDGYFISLYYTRDANASYAAGFSGSSRTLRKEDLPNTTSVALSNGRTGMFRPVSCGGSCAPANLWWKQNETTYQIQIKLPADLPESRQREILVSTANASVPVR